MKAGVLLVVRMSVGRLFRADISAEKEKTRTLAKQADLME